MWLIALQGAIPSFALTHSDVIEGMLRKRWSVTTLLLVQLVGLFLMPDIVFAALWAGIMFPPTSWAVNLKVNGG
jgi:hypothetical protein